jgi:hypothetical protein
LCQNKTKTTLHAHIRHIIQQFQEKKEYIYVYIPAQVLFYSFICNCPKLNTTHTINN